MRQILRPWMAIPALIAVAVSIAALKRASDNEDRDDQAARAPARRAYVEGLRPLFDSPTDVMTDGPDESGLMFRDIACTETRNRRYAVEPDVRAAGFKWVSCKNGRGLVEVE